MESQTVQYDSLLTKPQTPEREGYTITGWYKEPDFKNRWNFETDRVKKDITLYAKWEVCYSIIYVLDGGINHPDNPSLYTSSDSFTFSEPTKEGYEFAGWFTDMWFNSRITNITEGSTGSLTLYARWKRVYQVEYVLNGGTNHPLNPETFTEGDSISLYHPYKGGYAFGGWFADSALTQKVTVLDSNIPNTVLYAKFTNGEGADDLSPILTANELKNISLDGKYYLAYDINLQGENWAPIGIQNNQFSGIFDGNGYKIHNFTITSTIFRVGFFGITKGTVKNLGLEDYTINTTIPYSYSPYYVGGIAGENFGTITNCYSSGEIVITSLSNLSLNLSFGGLVGCNHSTISYCHSTGDVTAQTEIPDLYGGGLVGFNSGMITSCYSTGNVFAAETSSEHYSVYTGGLVGKNFYGDIINCYSAGNITATAKGLACAGGLSGENYTGNIANCHAWGNVTAQSSEKAAYAGGLVGRNYITNKEIFKDCYATGNVEATTSDIARAGGLVGFHIDGEILNCYAVGNVKAESTSEKAYAGGLVGENSKLIKNCFAVGNVEARSNSQPFAGGLVGDNSGTITNCYRYSGQAFSLVQGTSSSTTASNSDGTPKSLDELKSADFLRDEWGTDSWKFETGKFPTHLF